MPPIERLQGAVLILLKPPFGISTAWAYSAWANGKSDGSDHGISLEEVLKTLAGSSATSDRLMLYNSLEAPVFEKYPLLEIIKDRLESGGACSAGMSGSGSTMFGMFRDGRVADECLAGLKKEVGMTTWSVTVRL